MVLAFVIVDVLLAETIIILVTPKQYCFRIKHHSGQIIY